MMSQIQFFLAWCVRALVKVASMIDVYRLCLMRQTLRFHKKSIAHERNEEMEEEKNQPWAIQY